MNSTLDLLLKLNPEDIKKPRKKVEIKRLSLLSGEKVIFTCEAISADKFADIQEKSIKISNGQIEDVDTSELQIFTIIEGVVEPRLKGKDLQEKFNVPTPKELVKKLFLPGEITQLYSIISELSGFDGNSVEEIKNS